MQRDNSHQQQRKAKRRNHTIPRMLLKRFASRSTGDEHYVWQFRRGTEPFETNIKNSSTITDFYGEPSNGVEDSLSVIESRQSDVLNKILSGDDPHDVEDELRSLVWSLTIRTANIRSNFGDMFSHGLAEMIAQANDDTIKQWLPRRMDKEFDTAIEDLFEKLPPVQARALRISLERRPALRAKLRQYVGICLDHTDVAGTIQAVLTGVRSQMDLEKITSDAHVQSLERLPTIGHVPDTFRPANWQLIRAAPQSVIIGDGACFAVQDSEEAAHLLRYAKDWSEIYLPIAHDAVLVASRSTKPELYSLDEINRASASLSYDQFFAARSTDHERFLHGLIRTGTATLTIDEMRQIVREAWSGE